jgi:predicted lysophospholipase L1 biosynthesis ABC-type transport system permease subunit
MRLSIMCGTAAHEDRFAVAGEGVGLGAARIATGVAAAFGVTRILAKLLFGINATDPATFASVATVLLVVASLASYVPARRAMRVDPIQALREEWHAVPLGCWCWLAAAGTEPRSAGSKMLRWRPGQ